MPPPPPPPPPPPASLAAAGDDSKRRLAQASTKSPARDGSAGRAAATAAESHARAAALELRITELERSLANQKLRTATLREEVVPPDMAAPLATAVAARRPMATASAEPSAESAAGPLTSATEGAASAESAAGFDPCASASASTEALRNLFSYSIEVALDHALWLESDARSAKRLMACLLYLWLLLSIQLLLCMVITTRPW